VAWDQNLALSNLVAIEPPRKSVLSRITAWFPHRDDCLRDYSVGVKYLGWRDWIIFPVGSRRALELIVEQINQRHQGHERGLAPPVQKPSDGSRIQPRLSTDHPRRQVFGVH
jgi:hypothetical protein